VDGTDYAEATNKIKRRRVVVLRILKSILISKLLLQFLQRWYAAKARERERGGGDRGFCSVRGLGGDLEPHGSQQS